MPATLLIPQPDGPARELSLREGLTLLGRDAGCDVVIASHLVSRRHAQIRVDGPVTTIADLGSRNGTTVNGAQLVEEQQLYDGDRIELGGVGAILFLDGDATHTRPVVRATGIAIDAAAQDVWVNGQRLSPQLSDAQFRLVRLLVEHAETVCTREMLIAAVWPDAHDGVSDEAIDALLKRVRARVQELAGDRQLIQTIRGRGVILRQPRGMR